MKLGTGRFLEQSGKFNFRVNLTKKIRLFDMKNGGHFLLILVRLSYLKIFQGNVCRENQITHFVTKKNVSSENSDS